MAMDIEGAKAFYGELFGWEIEDQHDEYGNRIYSMARLDGKAVAGLREVPPSTKRSPFWNTYVTTSDIDATMETVKANGGEVLVRPTQMNDSGTRATFADPTGAAFSAWQPQEHIGVQLGNVANTYSWSELMTQDMPKAQDFYSTVFGWTYATHEGMGDYQIIGEQLAGMRELKDQGSEVTHSHWGTYFTVDNLEESVAKAEALGGRVRIPTTGLAGGRRFTKMSDKGSASFMLLDSNGTS